jgi:hypothetical protein
MSRHYPIPVAILAPFYEHFGFQALSATPVPSWSHSPSSALPTTHRPDKNDEQPNLPRAACPPVYGTTVGAPKTGLTGRAIDCDDPAIHSAWLASDSATIDIRTRPYCSIAGAARLSPDHLHFLNRAAEGRRAEPSPFRLAGWERQRRQSAVGFQQQPCRERTIQPSSAATTTPSTRLLQPWQRHSGAGGRPDGQR